LLDEHRKCADIRSASVSPLFTCAGLARACAFFRFLARKIPQLRIEGPGL